MWLLRTQTKGEERPDSTPGCLGKEHPFSIPLDTGSLMVGEMRPKEVERGRKEGRSALGGGVAGLVAMSLGAPVLNGGLTDKALEPGPLHSSVPLKHHLLSLGQFSHLYNRNYSTRA